MTSNLATFVAAIIAVLAAVTLAGCGSPELLGPVANARDADDIRKAFAASESGGGGKQAAVATGTGWATLRGRFVFVADAIPKMPPYNVTKEPQYCTHNGTPPDQQYLLVDESTKGIKNIAVYLREASRVHESAQPTDEVVFDQQVCVFLSHVLPVTIGQTVDIKNSDPTGHNTNISGKNRFNQTIAAGASVPFKPQKEEALPAQVTCSIHPWMIAYMLPRENAYYAVTSQDGTFEIANLPAGEPIEIQVWHEHSVSPSGLYVNTPEAKALKWDNRGRFTVTIPEGETLDLGEIKVPASAFKG